MLKRGIYDTYTASKKEPDFNTVFLEKYTTTVIDLSKPEEELFKNIHSTFRYDIKSAEKRNLIYKTILKPNNEDCIDMLKAYKEFAKTKNIPPMNFRQILALIKTKSVYITKVLLDKNEISTHVYVFDKKNISLFSSFHNLNFSDNRLRSEANKYLHWKDILLFKSAGLEEYDFGGVNEKKYPGISKFKLSFGGKVIYNYRFIKAPKFIFIVIKFFKRIN